MNGVMLTALVLVVPSYCLGSALDKTGTNDLMRMQLVTQVLNEQEPAKAGSFLAEREGFEPSLPLRVNQFSRLTHSTALPPLRTLTLASYSPTFRSATLSRQANEIFPDWS